MRYPFDGEYPITSPFGWRNNPITGQHEFHDAVDFGTPKGTPILAATSGRVTLSTFSTLYGNYVKINESADVMTRYSHLSRVFVTEGQMVTEGQQIGEAGTTGSSTGYHLDFAVYQSGKAVDPISILDNSDIMFKEKLIQSIQNSGLDAETKKTNVTAVGNNDTDYLVSFLGSYPRQEWNKWKQKALECKAKEPDCKAAIDAAIEETEEKHKAVEANLSKLLEEERAKNVFNLEVDGLSTLQKMAYDIPRLASEMAVVALPILATFFQANDFTNEAIMAGIGTLISAILAYVQEKQKEQRKKNEKKEAKLKAQVEALEKIK